MDSQNTQKNSNITTKKIKSKRATLKNDTNIKNVSTKKTKNLKKSSPIKPYIKKMLYLFVFLSIAGSASYLSYKYITNPALPNEKETDTATNFTPLYKDENVEKTLRGWNDNDLQKLRDIIKTNTIDNDIIRIINDPQYSLNTVIFHLKDNFHILSADEAREYNNGYPKQSTGITFDSYYNVIDIAPYSYAWRNGIRKGYKLEQIDGKNLKIDIPSDDINDALTTHKNSRWMFKDKAGRRITYPTFKKEYPAGNIAEAWVYQNTLVIRIQKINIATPKVLYDLISNRIRNNPNIKGILIDLRDTGDDYYSGLAQTTWLLNKQQEQNIAVLQSINNQESLQSLKATFNIDQNIMNAFNKLPKIVWVDYNTKGSAEIITNNLISNGAKINGSTTFGSKYKKDIFNINNKYAIALTDKKVFLPDGKGLQITPNNNKAIFFVDSLYDSKRQ